MTKRFQMIALVLAMVFGLAVVASAQDGGEKITIKRDTRLGSEVLPKGEYNLRFVDGDKGEVIFVQGKHEVLKATYTVTKLDKEASNSVIVSTLGNDGSFLLKRVELKGKNIAYVFENTVAKAITR
ncbi:MAG TPA: hypothetical protein VKA60_13010 [Blastocatellia bacterium]|nr:hypothetical protein [Blastocatellia bacterium]